MKHYTFEQLCIAAAPTGSTDTLFADTVMNRIQADHSTTLRKVIHRSDKPRRMSIFTKLRHLPKAALILLALLTILTVTGTAYAVYTLWPKPVVHTGAVTKNQFGRTQVIASFKNCASQPQNSTFEIKSKSTLSPDELPRVLQARCEKDAIEKWTEDNAIVSSSMARYVPGQYTPTKEGDIQEWTAVSSVASKVVSLSPTALSLTGDEYNTPKDPLAVTPTTKFIVNGNEAKRDDIKPGDVVMYIKWDKRQYKYKSTPVQEKPVLQSDTLESKVLYVIKVDLPFEYYGPTKQNQIAERKPCYGNPEDSCLDGGGVDLYENLNVGLTRSQIENRSAELKTLQAVIQSHNGNVITVKSSSGRIVTLTLPYDVITTFNVSRSSGYNNVKIGVGDMLDIFYVEKTDVHTTTLDANKIQMVNFVIDFIYKDDPIKKY